MVGVGIGVSKRVGFWLRVSIGVIFRDAINNHSVNLIRRTSTVGELD